MTLTEKAAYLKGLAEGLKLDETTAEGKVLAELLGLVSEMATELSELREYVEELDDDLGAVEEDLYDEEDEDYYDDEDEEDDTCFYEAVCPSCGETLCFDESIDPTDITCPNCGEQFECELGCDGNCEGCSGCDDADEE